MVYAIEIRSRYTGEAKILGPRYQTREVAEMLATDKDVCHRCNHVRVIVVSE